MTAMPLLLWLAACGNDPLMELLPQGTLPPSPAPIQPAPTPRQIAPGLAPPLYPSGPGQPAYAGPAPVLTTPALTAPVPPIIMDSPHFAPGGCGCQGSTPGVLPEMTSPYAPEYIGDCNECSDCFCGGWLSCLSGWFPGGGSCPRVVPEYYDPYGSQASYGIDGFQPWRLGWSVSHDLALFPYSDAAGGTLGSMKIVEWNSNVRWSELIAPGLLFNVTGYFNAQYWDGPGGIDLPGQVDQISADMELGFFNNGPWSGQVAFHPQLVTDFDSSLSSNSFNFDGRVVLSYLASPRWTFVGGVAFWDRVNLLVVPHVGAIWTPAPRWELRLLYPKSRISYYMGRRWNRDFWAYGAFEYAAQAWQTDIGNPVVVDDRMQLTDDRFSFGVRWDSVRFSAFIEGGYVFNRQAKFAGSTPDFDLSNCGTVRAGWRF